MKRTIIIRNEEGKAKIEIYENMQAAYISMTEIEKENINHRVYIDATESIKIFSPAEKKTITSKMKEDSIIIDFIVNDFDNDVKVDYYFNTDKMFDVKKETSARYF